MAEAESTEKRVALVIGNSAYKHAPPLRNPRNDAAGVGGILAQLGFAVISGLDLGRDAMEDKLIEFETAIGGASAAMLFYAGHGLQVKGHNYLVPVDAKIEQEIQLKRRAFSLDELLEIMVRRARATLIFLDACRDNPFSRSLLSGMSIEEQKRYLVRSGLAEVKASQGSFIAFATAPDNTASDGRGANSPFTEALLAHIETPDVSVSDMMIAVRNDVLHATNNRQEPWDQSSLRERFCFKVLPATVQEEISPPEPEPTAAPSPIDSRTVEYAYWMEIKDGSSPELFEDFLRQFPDGVYALPARRKLETLRTEAEHREKKARERDEEEAQWQDAIKIHTIHAYVRFLQLFPNGTHAYQARKNLATLEEAEAQCRREEAARRKAERGEPAIPWRMAGGVAAGVLVLAIGSFSLWPVAPLHEGNKSAATSATERNQLSPEGKVAVMVRARRGHDKEQWFKSGEGKTESFQDCVNRDCTVKGPEMVVVPEGRFMMGTPPDETEALIKEYGKDYEQYFRWENPQHMVTIRQSLAVGKFAVTWDEWDACVADGGCDNRPVEKAGGDQNWGKGKRPVINVNWDDAQAYVKWLSKKTGKKYRLLSESEWEYAARAGSTTRYWWGDEISKDQANYGGGKTVPVDSYQPNPWGLYQVHGNVYEWVEDVWHENYKGAPTDGSAWNEDGDASLHVVRGGSWDFDTAGLLRSACRFRYIAGVRYNNAGFRIARAL